MSEESPQKQVLLNRDLLKQVFSWMDGDVKSQVSLSMLCKRSHGVHQEYIKDAVKQFLKLKDEELAEIKDILGVYKRIKMLEEAIFLKKEISKKDVKDASWVYICGFVDDFFEYIDGLMGGKEWINGDILRYLDSPEFFEKNRPTKNMSTHELQAAQSIAAMLANAKLVTYLISKEEELYPFNQRETKQSPIISFFKKFSCIKGIEEETVKNHESLNGLLNGICLTGDKELFIKVFKKYSHQIKAVAASHKNKISDYMLSYAIRSKNLDFVIYLDNFLNPTNNIAKDSIGAFLLKESYIKSEEISKHYGLVKGGDSSQMVPRAI